MLVRAGKTLGLRKYAVRFLPEELHLVCYLPFAVTRMDLFWIGMGGTCWMSLELGVCTHRNSSFLPNIRAILLLLCSTKMSEERLYLHPSTPKAGVPGTPAKRKTRVEHNFRHD